MRSLHGRLALAHVAGGSTHRDALDSATDGKTVVTYSRQDEIGPAEIAGDSVTAESRESIRVAAPDITMHDIVKRYGAVLANDSVNFDLGSGEIHALLGENGAGKSTLMKILFGMVSPDAGEIAVNGKPVILKSPRDALAQRIGMVHQHFLLVPQFSIAENVVLGTQPSWGMRLRKSQIEHQVSEVAHLYGMEFNPAQLVSSLSIDVQQRVEILKLLYRGATTLILDEPTAALGPTEVDRLFSALRDLRRSGHSVVIITHKLSEVMEIADRVTVLRAGRVVTVAARGTFDEDDLAKAMVGHSLTVVTKTTGTAGENARLTVRDLVVLGDRGEPAVDAVSFEVRPGEIVGMAGVEGNGQSELGQALAGLRTIEGGTIQVEHTDLAHFTPRDLHLKGVSIITEDRLQWDLIPELTVAENMALGAVAEGNYIQHGMLRRRNIRRDASHLLHDYNVHPVAPDLRAGALSGGNQQKIVLARELARNPRVLIVAQPTRGLDVAASEFVQQRLLELRTQGCAILLFSLDLNELLSLSDRVLVLYRGRIAYTDIAEKLNVNNIARAMAGMQITT